MAEEVSSDVVWGSMAEGDMMMDEDQPGQLKGW